MFLDPTHESTFFRYFEAFKEEFGAEKVIVVFPKSWIRDKLVDIDKYKPSKVQSWEMPSVGLRVMKTQVAFDLPVFD